MIPYLVPTLHTQTASRRNLGIKAGKDVRYTLRFTLTAYFTASLRLQRYTQATNRNSYQKRKKSEEP